MQYIIMLAIVLGLAVADFATGLIKGYVTSQLNSSKMRRGGVSKLCEIIIMATACGLEIGIQELGEYYQSDILAGIAGTVAAIVVFGYITIMELISILENYAEINKDAAWVGKLLKRLKNVNDKEDKS
ncbi:MAG: phage holin family protein [Ruminococcus sp.]|nr:phage holin family protein [Ruminococcus sp.]